MIQNLYLQRCFWVLLRPMDTRNINSIHRRPCSNVPHSVVFKNFVVKVGTFRVFMHTLIGPDDSQTQWFPVPFVAIALGTNSLVGCCLGDCHRGSNNIALLVRICKKIDQGKFSLHAQFGPLNVGSASPDSRPDFRWNKDGSSQLGPMTTPRVGVSELMSRLE